MIDDPCVTLRGVIDHGPMYGSPREALATVYGLLVGASRAGLDVRPLWLKALFASALLRGNRDTVTTHEDVARVAAWFLAHADEWQAPRDLPLDALFVCGHRALDQDVRAEWWATRAILARLARLRTGGVLVTGGADGPDQWAHARAAKLGVVRVTYDRYGRVRVERPGEAPAESRWLKPGEALPTTRAGWGEHLLRRNRVMVDALAKKRAEAPHARIEGLALRCPWSETDGTGMTTRYAATKPGVFDRFAVETYVEPA